MAERKNPRLTPDEERAAEGQEIKDFYEGTLAFFLLHYKRWVFYDPRRLTFVFPGEHSIYYISVDVVEGKACPQGYKWIRKMRPASSTNPVGNVKEWTDELHAAWWFQAHACHGTFA